MKFIEFKGEISTPGNANNSNIDPNIEIIEITNRKTKEKAKVKILRDPSNYLNPILNNLTDKDLYSEKMDYNDVPLLNKIEKYFDLPEDIFIPVDCYVKEKKIPEYYFINKLGEILNINSKNLLSKTKNIKGYSRFIIPSFLSTTYNRIVSFTFLINPNPGIYKIVNHINHKRDDDRLSNLEFVTVSRNADKINGISSKIDEKKLTKYTAIDPITKEEKFSINSYNNMGYDVGVIRATIRKGSGHTYKGFEWKSTDSRKKVSRKYMEKLIGFSGKLEDYSWVQHYKYENIFVCKEGFVSNGKHLIGGLDESNYIVIIFTHKGKKACTRSHRLIVEHILRRDLLENEVVDHINGITYDNNINNLRLTDQKNNINNKITKDKVSKKIVISDKLGDFLFYGTCKEINERYSKTKKFRYKRLIESNFVNDNYLAFDIKNKEQLLNKMSKIIYILSEDRKRVLGAFKSISELISSKFPFRKPSYIKKHINSKKSERGYYLIMGSDAVKLIISLGHGTALNFIPQNNKDDIIKTIRSITDEVDCSEFFKNTNTTLFSVPSSQKPVDKYDLFGNFIEKYNSREEANLKNGGKYLGIERFVTGNGLICKNFLWCNSGDFNKIKEDLKYIYYRVDKDGNFISACPGFTNSISFHPTNSDIVSRYKKYLNTGMLAPDGFYYQQGIDFIEPDPNNVDLIPKRPILKWTPKNKRNNRNDIS